MIIKKEFFLFFSVMIVTFMIGFDTTGLGVAIPEIAAKSGFGVKEGTWLSVSYTAGFAAFLLPAGIITDKGGIRINIITSLLIFVLSSLYLTYCETLTEFTCIRLVQGVSAAFLNTSAMALLSILYPLGSNGRTRVFRQWSMFLGLSFAIGPILGSLIVNYASWEWIMFLNIPLGIIVALPFVSRAYMSTARKKTLGQVSLASSIPATVIILLVTMHQYFANNFSVSVGFYYMMALFLCFVVLGAIHFLSRRSFTRLPELRNGYFLISLLLPVFFSVSYWSLFVTLPGYITMTFGYTPMVVMLFMLCLSVPLTLVPLLALQNKLKLNAMNGFVFIAIGLGLLSFIFKSPVGGDDILLAITLFIMGVGASILNPIMARVVMDNVSAENSGLAAAITSTVRQLGFALGVALYSLMTVTSSKNLINISVANAFSLSAALPLISLLICIVLNKRSQLLSKAH
uniref:MFS transporter n=1 Tax=Scandinavium goeteborgense TaxID=1851514 RepID=UPI001359E3DE|nr:MFS transporter [Scandinavium goeteborgense]